MTPVIRTGSLFSGYGGLDLGVAAALMSFGIVPEPTFFVEFDDAPSRILAHHWPDVPNLGDVTKVDFRRVGRVNVLTLGFPCQDLSLAGRRAGMRPGTRSGLWSDALRAIEAMRPDLVIIENVRGLLSGCAESEADSELGPCPRCVDDGSGLGHAPHLRALGRVLGDLARLGFDAEWHGLPASDIGAPHGRFRIFVAAWPSEIARGGGSGGRTEGPESTGRDDAALRSDSRGDRGRADLAPLSLLPTPSAAEAQKSAGTVYAGGNPSLTRAVALLPTPTAQSSGNSPEAHLRKKPGREVVTDLAILAENGLLATGGRLLPTPIASDDRTAAPADADRNSPQLRVATLLPTPIVTDAEGAARGTTTTGVMHSGASLTDATRRLLPTPEAKNGSAGPDYARPGRDGSGGHDLVTAVTLLPTPSVAIAEGGQTSRSGDRKGEPLLGGIAAEGVTDWGPYADAVARWEPIVGREVPSPVRFDGRDGEPRLSPDLTEWMMGLAAGWITAPEIWEGYSYPKARKAQLKASGNGVVPQQAAHATRVLLERAPAAVLDRLRQAVAA